MAKTIQEAFIEFNDVIKLDTDTQKGVPNGAKWELTKLQLKKLK